MLLLAFVGAAAGLITTVSGFGGGLLLVTVLAVVWDPLSALVVSSAALLLGNTQRLYMFRKHIRPKLVAPLVLGAVPGSVLGSFAATAVPTMVLQIAIVTLTGAAVARVVFGWNWSLPTSALGPSAFAIGVLAAMTGGGGFLLGPLLLSTGMSGGVYIATATTTAVFMHIGRLAGYGAAGMLGTNVVIAASALAGCIVAGNLLGRIVRRVLTVRGQRVFEYGAPVLFAIIAVVGATY